MVDNLSKSQRQRCMSSVRTRATSIEARVADILTSKRFRIQRNPATVFGKPDIILASRTIAIFVDGCFWHGCKLHSTVPKTNKAFWNRKIRRNVMRDKRVVRELKVQGWRVFRIWQHELRNQESTEILETRLLSFIRKS